jgi:hypothetical protein
VTLLIRNGNDFGKRFPLIVAAVATLPTSLLPDRRRSHRQRRQRARGLRPHPVVAHDPLGRALRPSTCWRLDGQDLRRLPIEERKRTLAKLVGSPRPGIAVNDHCDGTIIFEHACKLVCEGIVSKRLTRSIAPADPNSGSRSRIPQRRRCAAKRKRTGGANLAPTADDQKLLFHAS